MGRRRSQEGVGLRPCVAGDLRARGEGLQPNNLAWQRSISTTHERVGDVLMASGSVAQALTSYETSFDIAEKVATAVPDNDGLQRDLAYAHAKIGDAHRAAGDLKSAIERHRAANTIFARLTKANPSDTSQARDLSVSHERIGDLESCSRRFARDARGLQSLRDHSRTHRPNWIPAMPSGRATLASLMSGLAMCSLTRRTFRRRSRATARRWPSASASPRPTPETIAGSATLRSRTPRLATRSLRMANLRMRLQAIGRRRRSSDLW